MKKIENFRSHGDVQLYPCKKSEGKVIKHDGSFVVELGEATGHRHVLTLERPEDLIIKQDIQGNYYFELKSEGYITHEEHKKLVIRPGVYRKIKEREKDWFLLTTRRVID